MTKIKFIEKKMKVRCHSFGNRWGIQYLGDLLS